MKQVRFKNWLCNVEKLAYNNGRIALELTDATDAEPILVATVNLPDKLVPDENHTFIKNWSENEGILDVLIEAGIIQDTCIAVPTGFCVANLVKVLI